MLGLFLGSILCSKAMCLDDVTNHLRLQYQGAFYAGLTRSSDVGRHIIFRCASLPYLQSLEISLLPARDSEQTDMELILMDYQRLSPSVGKVQSNP